MTERKKPSQTKKAVTKSPTKTKKVATKSSAAPKKAAPKKSSRTTQKTSKPTETKSSSSKLKYSKDAKEFPYESFPIRLEYKEGADKKTCWFQCEDHFIKHITRYQIKEYDAITNDVALVGESTGRKGTQKRSNRG